MWTGGSTRVWVQRGDGQVGDEVVVEMATGRVGIWGASAGRRLRLVMMLAALLGGRCATSASKDGRLLVSHKCRDEVYLAVSALEKVQYTRMIKLHTVAIGQGPRMGASPVHYPRAHWHQHSNYFTINYFHDGT